MSSDMPSQPEPDQCALNKNGQLKDANDIVFFHSPSNKHTIPLLPVDVPVDGGTGTGTDNGGMARIHSFIRLLMPCILACCNRPQQNKNLVLQAILAAEHLNKWGDLDKKHHQPTQYLKRKTKCIKVIDGLSNIYPEDDNKYQTDTTDGTSEADNASDVDISNREVSFRLLITLGSFKVAIIDPIIGSIIFTIMSFLGPIFD